jgi:hypothetical protein
MAVDYAVLPTFDDMIRRSADDVEDLARRLERIIDPSQHRLLHQLRLAAEQLGATRASAPWHHPL